MEKVCGIYAIQNKINGKRYVGKTADWARRKPEHLNALRRGKHCNPYLQAAFNKYGESSFRFVWIVDVEPERLAEVEKFFIDANKDGYNLCELSVGNNYWKDKHFSDEHKANLSASIKAYCDAHPRAKGYCRSSTSAKGRDVWIVNYKHNSKRVYGGTFKTEEEAKASAIEMKRRLDDGTWQKQDKPKGKGYILTKRGWEVAIKHNGRKLYGGLHKTEQEAKEAVDMLRRELANGTYTKPPDRRKTTNEVQCLKTSF